MKTDWVAIGVPVDSVGRAGGTELAPAAVRGHGLFDRIGARDAGDLDVQIRGDERDPETGVVGIDGVLGATTAVRAAVRDAVAAGRRPLVIGGCCSLVPGALAGVRDAAGAPGVAYLDGHVDVYDGRTSPTGEAADMPLGVALGRAPERWVDAAGGPSMRPDDVVVLGARDPEEAEDIASLRAHDLAALTVLAPAELRAAGPTAAGRGRGAAGDTLRGPRTDRPEPRLPEPGEGPGRALDAADVRPARRRARGIAGLSLRRAARSRATRRPIPAAGRRPRSSGGWTRSSPARATRPAGRARRRRPTPRRSGDARRAR